MRSYFLLGCFLVIRYVVSKTISSFVIFRFTVIGIFFLFLLLKYLFVVSEVRVIGVIGWL